MKKVREASLDDTVIFIAAKETEYAGWKKHTKRLAGFLEGKVNRIYYLDSFFSCFTVFRFLSTKKRVIYIPFSYFPALFWVLVGRLSGCKVVTRVSGQEHRSVSKLRFLVKYLTYNFSSSVIVLNSEQRAVLEMMIRSNVKIELIYNGVNLERFSPRDNLTKEVNNNDKIVIGFVGNICRRKGVWELVEAFEELCTKVNNMELVLVGPSYDEGDINETERVKRKVTSSKLFGTKLLWRGESSEIDMVLKNFDIFILPTYAEGMPNVLLEAMATGLCCVSTDIPGVSEVIEHQKDGFLVPPRDSTALSKILLRLSSDIEQVRKVGKGARLKVETDFDEKYVFGKYLELFSRG